MSNIEFPFNFPLELTDFICKKLNGKILVDICMNIANLEKSKHTIFIDNSLFTLNKKRIERYWDEKSFHSDGIMELAYNNDLQGIVHVLSYGKNLPYNKFPDKIIITCENITRNYQFFNVYIIALVRGNLEMIKLLVKNGFDIKTVHSHNNSLCLACIVSDDDLDIIEYLVDYGLDISFNDYETIEWACRYGHLKILEYLMKKIKEKYGNDKIFYRKWSLSLIKILNQSE